MKATFKLMVLCVLSLTGVLAPARAALEVEVRKPDIYAQKTILKMELHNTFTNAIESARAVVFLMDDKGKVVAQQARWILGGERARPGLEPGSRSTFFFVIPTEKPFIGTRVTVTRVILKGGKLANAVEEVKVDQEK